MYFQTKPSLNYRLAKITYPSKSLKGSLLAGFGEGAPRGCPAGFVIGDRPPIGGGCWSWDSGRRM